MGQIVGYTDTDGQANETAFLWENDVLTTIGLPGAQAYGINELGQIVGQAENGHACVWNDGVREYLWYSGERRSWARSINNSGIVAGVIEDMDWNYHAVIWSNNQATDLGNLGNDFWITVNQITDSGQVVGQSWTAGNESRPYLWQNGTMNELANFEGEATGINSSGQIVGNHVVDTYGYAFLWETGTITDYGTLGGDSSGSLGINDFSQIVGQAKDIDDVDRACLWDQGIIYDLNNILNDNTEWYFACAIDINNNGQIIGEGTLSGQKRGFLLSPISADFDEDDDIDGSDLGLFASAFSTGSSEADLNLDGNVDNVDLEIFSSMYGL